MDVTELKLESGKKYYMQAIVDNYSRYCLAWQIKGTKESINTMGLLQIAKGKAQENTCVFMDRGGENTSLDVSNYLSDLGLTRIYARFETRFSNSIVEAFFRSLKNNYLYYQAPKSLGKLEKLVGFYIKEHNFKIPHSAHDGLTPKEVYMGKSGIGLLKWLRKRLEQSIIFRRLKFYGLVEHSSK